MHMMYFNFQLSLTLLLFVEAFDGTGTKYKPGLIKLSNKYGDEGKISIDKTLSNKENKRKSILSLGTALIPAACATMATSAVLGNYHSTSDESVETQRISGASLVEGRDQAGIYGMMEDDESVLKPATDEEIRSWLEFNINSPAFNTVESVNELEKWLKTVRDSDLKQQFHRSNTNLSRDGESCTEISQGSTAVKCSMKPCGASKQDVSLGIKQYQYHQLGKMIVSTYKIHAGKDSKRELPQFIHEILDQRKAQILIEEQEKIESDAESKSEASSATEVAESEQKWQDGMQRINYSGQAQRVHLLKSKISQSSDQLQKENSVKITSQMKKSTSVDRGLQTDDTCWRENSNTTMNDWQLFLDGISKPLCVDDVDLSSTTGSDPEANEVDESEEESGRKEQIALLTESEKEQSGKEQTDVEASKPTVSTKRSKKCAIVVGTLLVLAATAAGAIATYLLLPSRSDEKQGLTTESTSAIFTSDIPAYTVSVNSTVLESGQSSGNTNETDILIGSECKGALAYYCMKNILEQNVTQEVYANLTSATRPDKLSEHNFNSALALLQEKGDNTQLCENIGNANNIDELQALGFSKSIQAGSSQFYQNTEFFTSMRNKISELCRVQRKNNETLYFGCLVKNYVNQMTDLKGMADKLPQGLLDMKILKPLIESYPVTTNQQAEQHVLKVLEKNFIGFISNEKACSIYRETQNAAK